MIALYDIPNSGNCAKVRLMLSLLGLEHELRPIDYVKGELASPAHRARNPFGQVPVLVDGDLTLRDSQAICLYLAKRYGKGGWLPEDAPAFGRVMQWVSFSANEIANGPSRARGIKAGRIAGDLGAAQALAVRALGLMDQHLAARSWLETGQATVADVVCYPYTKVAAEGDVPLERFAHVTAWHGRVEALQGFVPF